MVSVKVDDNLSYLSSSCNINLKRFTLRDYVLELNDSEPNRVLYIFNQNDGLEIKVSDLKENGMRLAQNYLKLGIKRGDRIAYISKNTSELIYSYFAAGFIGAINVPIDPDFPVEGLENILNNIEPKVLVYFNDKKIENCVQNLIPECLATNTTNNFQFKKFPFLTHLILIDRTKELKNISGTISFEELLTNDLDDEFIEMPYVDSDDNLYILFSVRIFSK